MDFQSPALRLAILLSALQLLQWHNTFILTATALLVTCQTRASSRIQSARAPSRTQRRAYACIAASNWVHCATCSTINLVAADRLHHVSNAAALYWECHLLSALLCFALPRSGCVGCCRTPEGGDTLISCLTRLGRVCRCASATYIGHSTTFNDWNDAMLRFFNGDVSSRPYMVQRSNPVFTRAARIEGISQ